MGEGIHPSHESYTGRSYFEIGDRVRFCGLEGSIQHVRRGGSKESPVFKYMVRFDDPDANEDRGWVRLDDLTKI